VSYADREFLCSLGKIIEQNGVREYKLEDLQTRITTSGSTPLGGLAQQKNIQTVAAAVNVISVPFCLTRDHFVNGIANVINNTGLMGRWQVLSYSPLTVCDTGHNREGLEYVVRQISLTPKKKLHMVIGFVNDKDLSLVLPLLPHDALYYFTKASVPRALDEKVLRAEAGKYGLNGVSYETVADALEAARNSAGADDMIFIGGSTFVVAEVV
jgi:dihydrofolate synthase/folylpolyglutamate synthase